MVLQSYTQTVTVFWVDWKRL